MTLSDDERHQLDATRSFISHFTSPEVGGRLHQSLEPRIGELTGLSIFATSKIGADERVVSCPMSWVITPEVARKAIDTLAPNAGIAVDGWKETMMLCGYICLHWMYHARSPDQLPDCLRHWSYIASLPPASTLRTPLHFTEAEIGLLEGANLAGAALDRRRQWTEEWEMVKQTLGDEVTWDQYLTASTYISSRAFPSKLLKISDQGQTETNAVQTSEEEESHPVLIPGMDMFNHARGQPVTWLTSSTPSPSVSLTSSAGFEADSQIFNNYGPKPNEELLLGYGFILSPNPDDVVPLRLGGMGSDLPEEKRWALEGKRLDAGKRWVLKRDGEIPRDLMEVLRVLMGDTSELKDDGAAHHEEEDDDDDEDHDHGHWEEEMELELDVLGALGQMLEDKLVRLEGVGEGVEAREDVATMCAVYRQGQVEILEKAMATVEERIERVERLTAEGQGCPCCN